MTSYASYLIAKKSVDDRALNRHVLDVLQRELTQTPRVRVLELGAGVGTMLARLADWNVLRGADYTLLDVDRESLDEAPRWLARWAGETGRSAMQSQGVLRISGGTPAVDITVRSVCEDIADFLARDPAGAPVDLLIANAFLDLVDVPATLPALLKLLVPNGLYWFSINFDGETLFQPEHAADEALIGVYHHSMDERVRKGRRAGESRTGRHLFQHLAAAGASILGAGSSDWVVHAIGGAYPAHERAFIESILHTIDAELNWRTEVDQESLRQWLATRRSQLSRGELVYIAHQLDFAGRR
ncbi:MAG TPA: class I SAM-dependent methyltransferase [Polyangiales bacterium]|nr:class I SAM-dependent methyltransferase [Polyangiales bacterium]